MALDDAAIIAIYDAVSSHAKASGLFDGVLDHEPWTSLPDASKMYAAVLLGPLGPAPGASGLSSTSGRLELSVRVYATRTSQPGACDRKVLGAATKLMAAYSGDFELEAPDIPDGLINSIDLLGARGGPMAMVPGWLQMDGAPLRVAEITLPVILNDVWGQSA